MAEPEAATRRRTPAIVVGVDFSKASRRAMQGAAIFAAKSGARLVLVHAFPKRPAARLGGAPKRTLQAAVRLAQGDEARLLTKWAEGLRAEGLEVEPVVREGKPSELLLSEAKRHKARMVALGTTGKGLLARAFLGSTARRVASQCPVPVLLFPQRGRNLARRLGPVVVGIDLAPGCGLVAEAAAAVAKDLDAGLHALHALQIPTPLVNAPVGVPVWYTPEMMAKDERDAAHALSELMEPLREGLAVRNFVELGDPATALLTHARRARASCIVVRRRRTRRTGFGSVSAELVQVADRPLLVVPAAGR